MKLFGFTIKVSNIFLIFWFAVHCDAVDYFTLYHGRQKMRSSSNFRNVHEQPVHLHSRKITTYTIFFRTCKYSKNLC